MSFALGRRRKPRAVDDGHRADRWATALGRWSGAIELSPPKPSPAGGPIACIDLSTRQTLVDFERLAALGLQDCEEALFAHEAGHHIRYPHTLVRARQHTRFLREELSALAGAWDLPTLADAAQKGAHDGLLNLLYDLLINTDLRPHYEAQFIRLYTVLSQGGADPIFGFYLALYEAWWYLPDGTLVTPRWLPRSTASPPTGAPARRRARSSSSTARQPLPAARALPHRAASLPRGGGQDVSRGIAGRHRWLRRRARAGRRRAGDATGARRGRGARGAAGEAPTSVTGNVPTGAAAGRTARAEGIRSATRRRCSPGSATRPPSRSPPTAASPLPARSNRRALRPGLPEVPGPPAEWQIGDRIESIDWFSTLTRGGPPIPGYTLQRRTWLASDPVPGDQVVPWIELYVDSSGSMPDPVRQLNHSILAGFILVDAATGASGRVRVVQYSHTYKAMPDFVQSPRPAYGALLSYVGGGTVFPWDELRRSVRRWRRVARVVRVIISDTDFSWNYQSPSDAAARDEGIDEAVRHGQLIALLDGGLPEVLDALRARGVQVVPVAGWDALPAIARALAGALFPAGEPS
ncbi:MAG: hypothetical protein H6701_12760 [Myxococcales bacterium]|nr:hypothetical protein [Myxococcales bacterium]